MATDIRFANYIYDPANYNDPIGEIVNILVEAGPASLPKSEAEAGEQQIPCGSAMQDETRRVCVVQPIFLICSVDW